MAKATDDEVRHVAMLALLYTLHVPDQAAFVTVVSIDPACTDSEGRADAGDIAVSIFQRMAPELTIAGRLALLTALRTETQSMIDSIHAELRGTPAEPLSMHTRERIDRAVGGPVVAPTTRGGAVS